MKAIDINTLLLRNLDTLFAVAGQWVKACNFFKTESPAATGLLTLTAVYAPAQAIVVPYHSSDIDGSVVLVGDEKAFIRARELITAPGLGDNLVETVSGLRRGTTAQHATFTGAEGEVTMDTSKKTLVVHDGLTAGGFLLALPTSFVVNCGNLVLVDVVNGNDTTAQRGKMQWPFLTLSAAKAAAVAGDTILVLPGTYTDANLAKNGVNWHFMAGAVVEGGNVAPAEYAIFDTGPLYAGTPATFKVTGHGVFRAGEQSGCVAVVSSLQGADDIDIECDSMEAFVPCIDSAGKIRVVCPNINSTDYDAIKLRRDTCIATLYLGLVQAGAGSICISVSEATATIFADELRATGYAVDFAFGFLDLTARELSSVYGPVVYYHDAFGGICCIRGARLVATEGVAVHITTAAAKVQLYGCHLVASAGQSASCYASVATNLYLYGESTANLVKHANVTLVGSALTVDAALV